MKFRNGTPLFRFLLLLICGILLAIYFPVLNVGLTTMLSCGTMAFFFLQFLFRKKITRYQRRWAKGAVSYLAVFFTGYLLTVLTNERNNPAHFRNYKAEKLIGYLEQPLNDKGKRLRSFIKVLYVYDGTRWKPAAGNCLVYFEKDSASSGLKYGDLILWFGKPDEVQPPPNPSQFNYKRWLEYIQVFDQQFIQAGKWKLLDHDFGNRLYAFSFSLRERLMKTFRDNNITGQDFAVLSALILGYEDEIDKDVIDAYAASGTLHVLSVSGLHVGIIFIAINALLGFLNVNKRTRFFKSVIIILFLWFYALLTGLSPSVLRSATMLSFIIVGRMTRQHVSLFNTLSASAFFLLAFDPFMIMQVGFQLSYLAVLGIIFLQPTIHAWLDPPGWILRNIWSITSVSIAAQLATFPLGFFYFHQFPVYFLFSNLIIIPVSTVIIYGGILLLMFSWWHFGGGIIGLILGFIVKSMNAVALFIEHLPWSVINGISISVLETWFLYIGICAFVIFFEEKNKHYLFLTLFSILAILTGQLIEANRIIHQEKLIVYSIRGKSVLNIIDGKMNILFTDSATATNRRLMLFNIYQYWWDCGLDERKVYVPDSTENRIPEICFYRGFLQFEKFRIAFVSDARLPDAGKTKPVIDFLILSGNIRTKVKQLTEHFNFKQLIIDSSVAPAKAMRLLNEAKESGIMAYSVQHQGAFVYDLSQK